VIRYFLIKHTFDKVSNFCRKFMFLFINGSLFSDLVGDEITNDPKVEPVSLDHRYDQT
jgi:hypothetical protein